MSSKKKGKVRSLLEKTPLRLVGKAPPADIIRHYFNRSLTRVDRRLLPISTLSIPCFIQLEPTNKCNLRCRMCHRTILPLSKVGELSFNDFKKIVDPLLPYLASVWLQGQGEPFLCSDIFKMIRYLKRRYVYVNTVTNGTLLSEDVCKEIVSSGLDEVAVSLDGATAETYERIRVGADFEEVTRNVQRLTSTVGHSNRKKMKVAAFSVAMRNNFHELPDLVTLVHRLGVKYLWVQDVQFQQLDAGLATKEESLRAIAEQNDGEKGQIEQFLKTALQLARKYDLQLLTYGGKSVFDRLYITRKLAKCIWPWTSAYITWDGFVSPCCIPSTYFCGNVFEEPFKKIWNNEKYHSFRRQMKSARFPYQCINCSFL